MFKLKILFLMNNEVISKESQKESSEIKEKTVTIENEKRASLKESNTIQKSNLNS